MKLTKLFLLPLLSVMALTGCQSTPSKDLPEGDIVFNITDRQISDFKGSPVNLKLWTPITGPDSGYLQNLVAKWNAKFGDYLKITSDPLSEKDHYVRIITSLSDNSTADLTLIHQSTVASYQKTGKLRPMDEMLSSAGIQKDQYLSTFWDKNVYDGHSYALAYDLLPTLLFYNKKLIPEGFSEAMIQSEDFTVEKMREMMKAAYVHDNMTAKRTYGMAFNYAFTEKPFLSFLYEQGGKPVDAAQPTTALFNDEKGVAAATALMNIPQTFNESGKKVASESGADHLDIFGRGRALFTIDGLWSSSDAIVHNDYVDAGVAFLPKVAERSGNKKTYADSHCFVSFTNKNNSSHRDKAMSLVLQYFVDNSAYWCQGGKVAVRNDTQQSEIYKKLEWSFASDHLSDICLPESIYTYNSMVSLLGEYCSKLCEGTLPNGTLNSVQAVLDKCASESEELAKKA